MVSMLWQDRHQVVFGGSPFDNDKILSSVIHQVEFLHHQISSPIANQVLIPNRNLNIRWLPPPSNVFKLNTDGSHFQIQNSQYVED